MLKNLTRLLDLIGRNDPSEDLMIRRALQISVLIVFIPVLVLSVIAESISDAANRLSYIIKKRI